MTDLGATIFDSSLVVMLTADYQIDRRILLEADSLEAVGWKVVIVGSPLDSQSEHADPRVVRVGVGNGDGGKGTPLTLQRSILRVHHGVRNLGIYRVVRNSWPMNGWLMRKLKSSVWRLIYDPEVFFTNLFAGTALRYSPAVFVAHDLPMLPVARLAAESKGAKLVYDSHELFSEQEFSSYDRRRWSALEAKHINACDAVITVNPSIAQELERRYALHGVNVVYNAERQVNSAERNRRFHEIFGLDSASKVLLFQGGLSAGRHIEALVKAMSLVKNSHVHLVILGDGQLKPRLQTLVEKMSLQRRVHFHPAVPQNELLGFTASADAGIIPYQATCLNNYYCTPNKLFEFIAAGLPILASNLPEIQRIISSNQIGMVGDLSTVKNMASVIDKFFSDDLRLREWRTHVFEAQKVVCWEHEGKKIVSIFESFR